MPRKTATEIQRVTFERPSAGFVFTGSVSDPLLPSGQPAWQSNGGPQRGHPARSLPFTLEAPFEADGDLAKIHVLGVFSLFAGREEESPGTLGASLQIIGDRDPAFRHDLLNGRHYEDARNPQEIDRTNGDGSSLRTVGFLNTEQGRWRVDLLSVDVAPDVQGDRLRFKDLGSPASFLIFDIFIETMPVMACPFHSRRGGVALSELPSIVRVGDRVKFQQALDQLEQSITTTDDLDDARGQALTFLAMVTAATLEMGGSREMHRVQLDAAREFDTIQETAALALAARQRVEEIGASAFKQHQSPSSYLVDRALSLVERNYARDLSDASVAAQLGLSTSHFRYLFKETTGQPFHKYLVALRLEKARQLLVEQDLPVSEVARAVGFGGLSHFSRAFTQRFSVSPTHLRRGLD